MPVFTPLPPPKLHCIKLSQFSFPDLLERTISELVGLLGSENMKIGKYLRRSSHISKYRKLFLSSSCFWVQVAFEYKLPFLICPIKTQKEEFWGLYYLDADVLITALIVYLFICWFD